MVFGRHLCCCRFALLSLTHSRNSIHFSVRRGCSLSEKLPHPQSHTSVPRLLLSSQLFPLPLYYSCWPQPDTHFNQLRDEYYDCLWNVKPFHLHLTEDIFWYTRTHARTRSVLVAIWQGVREQPWAAPPVDYEGLRTNTYRRERRNWTLELPVTGLPPPPSNRGVCSQWIADPSHTNTHLHWGSTSEKNDIRATLWRLCDYITWMMFFKQIPEI